jgi:glycerate kinase
MTRKIIFAPDSFKGTLSAGEVCAILEAAARESLPDAELLSLPLSDGGEGLVDSLLAAQGGERISVEVQDPLFRPVSAAYGILPDQTAVIEMAAASGLPLLGASERNPMRTSTFGTGQLIADALARGCRKIILGLGGSATNDGGIGAAAALGFRFLGESGDLPPIGASLPDIRRIDCSAVLPVLRETRILIACDVTNPLYGPTGAAAIFGPQKGATPDIVAYLDQGLTNLAAILRRDHHFDPQKVPGSGAAGGLAVPFLLLGQAEIRSGLDLVLDQMDFDRLAADCDLIVTGEGRTDAQSAMGKVLSGLSRRASRLGRPVVALSGAIEPGSEALYNAGIIALFATLRRVSSLENALANAPADLAAAARDLFRLVATLWKTTT